MPQKIITICYRKIIDVNSAKTWDRLVFDDTYTEFKMQAQSFNAGQKYTSFSELLNYVPGAENLPYLVSAAALNYLRQLKDKIPDIADNLGRQFLNFKNFQFEIIESGTKDKSKHKIAINFISEPLVWHETIDNYILVSACKEPVVETLTNLLQLQPFVSIYSLKTDA